MATFPDLFWVLPANMKHMHHGLSKLGNVLFLEMNICL